MRFKGAVYTGDDHAKAVSQGVDAGHFRDMDDFLSKLASGEAEDGYITHAGGFIDRVAAKKLASKAGQLNTIAAYRLRSNNKLDSSEIGDDRRFTGRQFESVDAMIAHQLIEKEEGEYRGLHTAPDEESAPMHDLTGNGVYPKDVYDMPHYYHGGDEHQAAGFYKALRVRGKPDKDVMIFRAVPKGVKEFNPGDWVTPVKAYAREHGKHVSDPSQDMHVIRTWVKAKHLHTNGDSLAEWGYNGTETKRGDVVFRPRKPLTPEQRESRNLQRRMISSERRRQEYGSEWR